MENKMTISTKLKIAAAFTTALTIGGITGCSDANRAAMGAWGDESVVLAYSAGKLTHAGISTGKVDSESNSDGYYYNDRCNGETLVEVGGDVNILRHPSGDRLSCEDLPKVEVQTYKFD
jgi:hypothetical protein